MRILHKNGNDRKQHVFMSKLSTKTVKRNEIGKISDSGEDG